MFWSWVEEESPQTVETCRGLVCKFTELNRLHCLQLPLSPPYNTQQHRATTIAAPAQLLMWPPMRWSWVVTRVSHRSTEYRRLYYYLWCWINLHTSSFCQQWAPRLDAFSKASCKEVQMFKYLCLLGAAAALIISRMATWRELVPDHCAVAH